MCEHILKAGFNVTVFNRTASKYAPLVTLGAVAAGSPREVAEKSDVVFTMLGYPTDVHDIILGEQGVLSGLKAGGIVVDMTTSEPSLAKQIASVAPGKSVQVLDAPVSGGDVGARNATLSIMVGGDKACFDHVLPLLEIMGKNIRYLGGPGAGQHTKMVT